MQAKTKIRKHYIVRAIAKVKMVDVSSVGKDVKQVKLSYMSGEKAKLFNCFGQ